jgi:Protein of unknown function (DUF3515)
VSATPSKPVLAVAVGLPVLLAIGVAVIGLAGGSASPPPSAARTANDRVGPLPLVPVDAPAAADPGCAALLKALPRTLPDAGATVPRRELAKPAPPSTVAWGDSSHDPIVLRCGLGKPPELVRTAELGVVSGVRWLQVKGDNGNVTWYVVDRSVYIALTEPTSSASGPVQAVSAAVTASLPPVPVSPNPG